MRKNIDFLIAGLINIFLLILVAWGEANNNALVAFLRIVFGFGYLVFIPGYAMQAALLPQPGHISSLDRVVISFALSIALMPVMGLILDGPLGGIFLWQSLVFLSLVTGLFAAIAIYRRSRLGEEDAGDAPTEAFGLIDWWRTTGRVNRALFAALLGMVVTAVFVTGLSLSTPKSDQRFTEFFVLNANGLAANYPQDVVAGQPFTLKVAVTNHEGMDSAYAIQSQMNGQKLAATAPFTLADGQSISLELALSGSTPGDRQPLEILLLRDNQVYRRLSVWLNVKSP